MAGSASPGGTGSDINPSLPSAAATTMLTRTTFMDRIYGGTETMRAAAKELLPQYERESDSRYKARLESTFAINKLKEAVEAASAKPFKNLLQVKNGDPELDLWIRDIDLMGNHLHIFGHRMFNNGLRHGLSHFLVDHPSTYNMPNLAAQQAAMVRPYFRQVINSDLIAAYDDHLGSDVACVHARIKSSRVERTPDYKEIIWNQIYVIEVEPGATQGIVQLYEQQAGQGGGQWTRVGEAPLTMPEVPLVTMYAGERDADYVAKSIFQDLAYKQQEHWISSSDQRSILSVARFPMLASSGVQLDEEEGTPFEVGPFKLLFSPEAQGRWYFVEPTGRAIESGFKDLAQLEMHMDMMALNPVVSTHRQYVPQNERDIQETRVHSVVHDLALANKEALERGIRFMGLWTGKDYSQVTINMNLDFSNTGDKLKEVAELIKAWEKRGISRETFLAEARRRDFFGEDFDLAKELGLMAAVDDAEAANALAGKEGAKPTPSPQSKPVGTASTDSFDGTSGTSGQTRPTSQI